MYSIFDLLSLVMEEGQQIKRKKLMQAIRIAFKIAADSSCWSISLPLPKNIVHLTEDMFTNILLVTSNCFSQCSSLILTFECRID